MLFSIKTTHSTAQAQGNNRHKTATYRHFKGVSSSTDTAEAQAGTQTDDRQITHRTQSDDNTIRNKEIKN